ncbi:MAG: hypothetical protein DMG30_10170 [Acidobacteria bacterium]|nr:MAG: hypothetical protein DMG30_10170 [Acidobacteriota bacterium]
MRLEQRAAVANPAMELTAGDEALNRNGAVRSQVPAIVLASRLKEACDGSFRPMLPEAVPICQSALGSPSTRISPLAVSTLSAPLTPRSVTSPEAASIRALPAAAASAGNDRARYMRRVDIAAPSFCVQALNRVDGHHVNAIVCAGAHGDASGARTDVEIHSAGNLHGAVETAGLGLDWKRANCGCDG